MTATVAIMRGSEKRPRETDISGGTQHPSDDLMRRLWAKVDKRDPDECWPFTGYTLKGYGRIGLGGRTAGIAYAHRVVTLATHGPPPFPGAQARHLCGNSPSCNPAHLAWGDQSANEMDKVGHGTSNRGSRHGMSKCSEADIRRIRAHLAEGKTQKTVGAAEGLSPATIGEISRGEIWGWLK